MSPRNQWAGYENNNWTPVGATIAELKPDFYFAHPGGMFSPWGLASQRLVHDTIIVTGLAKLMSEEIDKFWASADLYTKFGFLHKRGIFMIGEPGVGKSMTAMLLARHVIAKGGSVITARNVSTLNHALHQIRAIHPNMPLMNLMEDVEAFYHSSPNELLSLLDGEDQINNVIHIATTNQPAVLDARFLDRPGRFDSVAWVGLPDAATRRAYLTSILPADTTIEVIDTLVAKSKGLLLSHLRELIASVMILGRSIDTTIAALKLMREGSRKNNIERDKLGFAELFTSPSDDIDDPTEEPVAAAA